jgi:hypothetical protein
MGQIIEICVGKIECFKIRRDTFFVDKINYLIWLKELNYFYFWVLDKANPNKIDYIRDAYNYSFI